MFGTDKVPFFMFSKLCLMPGAVGLVILDAFALETPLITTNITYHGPEIDYLVDGINGIIVQETEDPNSYAEQVAYLLQDKDALDKLKEGCRIAKTKYTMNEMVERFASGIIQALKT